MSNNTTHCSKKYYKSRCIIINIVTINSATRNTAKFILTFLTLAGTVRSSEVVTNMINESAYASSKTFDVIDSLEEIVKFNDNNDSAKEMEISKETIENVSKIIESEKRKDSEKNLEKSSKSDEQKAVKSVEKKKDSKVCESSKKSKNKTQNRKAIQPEIQKNESEKKDVDLSHAIVLRGDATAYAPTGKNMANGKPPKPGVHCAMRRDLIGKNARVVTDSGKVFDLIVGDTGGALEKGTAVVDIHLGSVKECINFGREKCTVYVY